MRIWMDSTAKGKLKIMLLGHRNRSRNILEHPGGAQGPIIIRRPLEIVANLIGFICCVLEIYDKAWPSKMTATSYHLPSNIYHLAANKDMPADVVEDATSREQRSTAQHRELYLLANRWKPSNGDIQIEVYVSKGPRKQRLGQNANSTHSKLNFWPETKAVAKASKLSS